MRSCRSASRLIRVIGLVAVATLLVLSSRPSAEERTRSGQTILLSSSTLVDVSNVFANVGALIYFIEPNDVGFPTGILTHCTVTLIHERAVLLAGHSG